MVQSEASELHPVTESIRSGDLLNAYDSVVVTVRRERRWTSAGATPARELVRSTR
jgi:hypothetical protein